MDSVTLELCDSRDYFASSLLIKKTREKAVVYSLGIELFALFMPRHTLEKVPD